jgi:putative redox protein
VNVIDCETERPGGTLHTVRVRAHVLHADMLPPDGGADEGPGAHDLFDAALAVCKAHTAMWYARRKGIPLERVETHIERDDTDERKGVYRLRVRVAFHGALTDEQRAQLAAAVAKCPVHKLMTSSDVQIEMVE